MSSLSISPVALITGAGRRVGNCVARTLAARGYAVVLHAGHSIAAAAATADELTAAGGRAIALAADLRDEAAARAMIDDVQRQLGRIDALVNCAAVWNQKSLEETTADDLREHWEVNVLATFVCARQAGLIMAGQPSGGSIVNVGDWAVLRPYLDYSAYFASKGAIPTLTRTLAVELARRNPRIRVNAVLPGPVMLPDDMPADERQAVIAQTLLKREGRPENIADAVVFLLENDYITGVCLPVDGGRSIYAP